MRSQSSDGFHIFCAYPAGIEKTGTGDRPRSHSHTWCLAQPLSGLSVSLTCYWFFILLTATQLQSPSHAPTLYPTALSPAVQSQLLTCPELVTYPHTALVALFLNDTCVFSPRRQVQETPSSTGYIPVVGRTAIGWIIQPYLFPT